ncbi:iron complex outermembrane receptor protein [Novosphingobium fluoreni]|uniref:Iron complex outermembrane receptor protein n=1 Tax=Novosphingobium fluoreni TaxID=1391222 RepID=A0A7W6C2S4_9SPHN|nr:TonB-dependent receptor [Novosphingobium fluoreni]MBB3941482.1 iron complex outermembrane receptor protein [Novosphingobium fluoreni]
MGPTNNAAWRLALLLSTSAISSPALAEQFNIDAGEAQATIPKFAEQAGVQILAPANTLRGVRTNEVHGTMSPQVAAQRLIAGSGLRLLSQEGRTILIGKAQPARRQPPARMTQPTPSPQAPPAPAPSAVTGAGVVDDIVVTADRRERRLQDVPIAVTALSGESLVAQGVTQTIQLPQVVPGLVLARNTTILQPSIRGVGSRASTAGDESNVAIYIDGIYQPTSYTGVFDLLQVDRVEVLRGPQGTLFGRNATGGLINVITANPKFDFSGNAQVRAGRFGERSIQGYVTGPISQKIAFDVGAYYYRDHGYVRDLNDGGRTGRRRSFATRGKLLFEPTDTSRSVLSLSYMNGNDQSALAVQPVDNQTIGRSQGATNLPAKPWQSSLSLNPIGRIRQFSAAWLNHVELGGVDLDLATAYQADRLRSLTDSDASNAPVQFTDTHQRSRTLSQEIRLSSNGGGPFTWIAGGYGFLNKAYYYPIQTVRGTRPINIQDARNITKSLAAFAEGTYAVTDALSLTVGGRYSYEHRRFTATNTNTVNTVSIDPRTSFKQFTPRAIVKYDIAPRANIYASYSRGFKSGVFNTGGRSPLPVEPEKITAYEGGIKADPLSWLRTNLSVFFYDYKDIQLSQRDPNGVSILQNAGVARMKGGELEVTAQATRDLSLRAAASYLDAKFRKFDNAVVTVPLPNGGNNQIAIDAAGKDSIRAPKFTLNVSGTYQRDLGPGTLGLTASVFYSDKFFWDYLNRLKQPHYAIANGEISWTTPGQLRIGIYGTNLTNKAVQSNVVTSTLGDYASYQRPRSYGVSVAQEF